MAVLLKAIHTDAMLISPQGAELNQEKDIVYHIEGLLLPLMPTSVLITGTNLNSTKK